MLNFLFFTTTHLFLGLLLLGCAHSASFYKTPLVLVHGAHFSAESFDLLRSHLQNQRTLAVELGNDRNGGKELSLSVYAERVCKAAAGFKEEVILAGHSQGGAVINQALGMCPDKIKALIYIAATIPFPGEKPFALLAPRDDEYYFKAVTEAKEQGVFRITSEVEFLKGFAQDATSEQKSFILSSAKDEPIAPSATILEFDLTELQKRPKLVIITSQDRIITPETQRTYAQRLQQSSIEDINSGHLPMVTSPSELAHELRRFQEQY